MFQTKDIYAYLGKMKNETLVMGILNVTPDSFSDGGRFNQIEIACEHAHQMIRDGAHIIDIGGESTRPGHQALGAEDELMRVLPVIERLSKEIDIPISIDTYKASVAEAAILAGASIINDVWGAKRDRQMGQIAKKYNVPIILMHNREEQQYADFLADVQRDLQESIDIVRAAGVRDEQIILDPGIGFAKDFAQNICMMQNLEQLHLFGYPVLLAVSRKRMIGSVLDLAVDERMEGSIATACFGVMKGIHMVRVHDVKETMRAMRMIDTLYRKREIPNG